MPSRLPLTLPFKLSNTYSICIICEGNEEYKYLDRLLKLSVWNSKYEFHLINAEGNTNIFARYQDRYQSGSYDLILVFCDTERITNTEKYKEIKRKIDNFHDVQDISSELVIFGNPCTLQIVIKHFDDIVIKTVNKRKNAEHIERLTGIKNYKARKDQLDKLYELITINNYKSMMKRLKNVDINDDHLGSTNFYTYSSRFESDNTKWIDDINNTIEK